MPPAVTDVSVMESLFAAEPEVHLYGLADLEEPFWSLSRWWRDGGAAAGLIRFPGGSGVAGYAMSRSAPDQSLELFAEVAEGAPAGTTTTGPIGLARLMSRIRSIDPLGAHLRLIYEGGAPGAPEVEDLGPDSLPALQALYATDPGAAFFLPHMLENGHFVGIWQQSRLLAAAGTHVASEKYSVAAIGAVMTDPAHRGRRLGERATRGLLARLVERYATIGLNVAESNSAARHLYERLGFVSRFSYEEIVLR